MTDRATFLNRLLLGLLVATLFAYWRLAAAAVLTEPGILTLVVSLHLALLGASIVGLWRFQRWGFYSVYILIPTSTVLLSISFVPFLPGLFPLDLTPVVLTLVNAGVMLLAVLAHVARENGAWSLVPRRD